MRRLLTICITLTGIVATGSIGQACSVPVFRYALERWQPGAYRVIVFHEGKLAVKHQQALQFLKDASKEGKSGLANFFVETVDLAGKVGPGMRKFYQKLGESDRAKTHPLIVVRYAKAAEIDVPFWIAPLNAKNAKAIVDSPARRAIAERIIKGHSVVWILLDSGDAKATQKLLETGFRKMEKKRNLSKSLPLIFSSAIGLFHSPGGASPVMTAASFGHKDSFEKVTDLVDRLNGPVLPIPIRFSVVRVNRNDPAESFLVSILLNSEPPFEGKSLKDLKESMVFPIFGRGRSRYAMVGKGINAENVGSDAQLLTGPCTCTVKSQIRGFDLLIAANWKDAIGETLVNDKDALPPLIGLGGAPLPTIRDIDPPGSGGNTAEPKQTVSPEELSNLAKSISRMLVKLDRRQNPWKELLDMLESSAKANPAKKGSSSKEPNDGNKQASKSSGTLTPPEDPNKQTTSGLPPEDQENSPEAGDKKNNFAANDLGSPLLRNTIIAVIAGIVIVGAVYIFARRGAAG